MKKDIQFTIPKQATESPIIDLLNHLGEDYLKYNSRFESISTWLVEFSHLGLPIREIGFNHSDVVVKAPYNEIGAFWKTTCLKENDLQMFFEVSAYRTINFR